MLFILISWCYIFLTLLNFGYLVTAILKISKPNSLVHFGLGLTSVLIGGHLWAFFGGFGLIFHVALFLLNVILSWIYRKEQIKFFRSRLKRLSHFGVGQKLLLLLIFIIILAKSASLGTVLDNENYYIQTIKWLVEYGFVSGLANLHLFLGQTSGWHVLQSIFSFHFLGIDFNDLGGFILLLFNAYAIAHFKSQNFLILGGLPVLNWLLLEFTVVPSPDFGVIVFSILIVIHFLNTYQRPQQADVLIGVLFFLSAFLIKITALGLIVFPIVLFLRTGQKNFRFWFQLASIFGGMLILWIIKNLILTGYPVFPSEAFSSLFTFDHQLPETLYNYSLRQDKLLEFFASTEELNSLSAVELFWKWLTHSKLGLIFNSICLAMVFIWPVLIFRMKPNTKYWWLYASFLIQVVFLAFTSPQYRFALHYVVVFIIMIFSFIDLNSKIKLSLLYLSQAIAVWFLIFPVRYNAMSSKAYALESSGFLLKNIIVPAPNSSITSGYEKQQFGNLIYNSPKEDVYFWSNGNGDLPCVNEFQLQYLTQKIRYRPQLIDSTDLSKGFFAEKVSID